MIKKIFFPFVLILLGYAFFVNPVIKEVAAGVAILLFGMILLEEGFNAFVEGPLQKLLKKATDKLYKSLGLGFIVTALLQSSSLISVITISFLSAGLIGLPAGIGIVFGANIGTTTTAWLVAFFGLKIKVSSLAMPMLAFGILFVFQKSKNLKGIGHVLAGLGFFFLGVHFMKHGFEFYQESINLADYALKGYLGVLVYTLIGIIITVILQSSSAAIALILIALASNQITYDNSLALAIGANVGTTITAILGALGSNAAGKRLAGAHLLFKSITAVVALIFLTQLHQCVDFIAQITNVKAGNYAFKLAIFHTAFNLLGVAIMLPWIKYLIQFLNHIIKDDQGYNQNIEYPVFLNKSVLIYPQTAIEAVYSETKRLFEESTFEIVAQGLNLELEDIIGDKKLKKVVRSSKEEIDVDIDELYYQKVKMIYSKIIKYITLAQSGLSLTLENIDSFTRLKLANRNIVASIKDIRGVRKNVILYLQSDNKYIQKEYDQLRHHVSKVLREINNIQNEKNIEASYKQLQKFKTKAEKSDVLLDGTLDELIRERKISSTMAASLANDSDNVARITLRLIKATELLYINSDTIIN